MNNSSLIQYVDSTFHIADYVVFATFLSISAAVGIYFSIRGQKTTKEYFLGGQTMRPVPVGISLGVSFMSAASLVGLPAETYINGYSYIMSVIFGSFGFLLGSMIIANILQPLSMTSLSEYLQCRYKSRLITHSSNIIVLICIIQYMGVCMIGSVVAFSSVTGNKVTVISGLVIGGVVGVFCTAIGGMKAVIWTDVIQFGFMILGIATVVVTSIIDTPGGLPEIYRLGVKYGRIHAPIWTFDLTIRHTIWGLSFGMFVYWIIWCVQPACVQRLCCTQSKNDAYIVALVASVIFVVLEILPAGAGINIFGYYSSRGCDIFAAGWIKNNEIILYYIRDRLRWPGFQGLFIAALYSGSLSSLSSGLNAAAAILWKDVIKPALKVSVTEKSATLISKIIVVCLGVVSMVWCYLLYIFEGLIMQMSITIDASMYGAYFGTFTFSILCVNANWKGAVTGMIISFGFTLCLGLGSLLSGSASGQSLPTVTDHCQPRNMTMNILTKNNASRLNSTVCSSAGSQRSIYQILYSISYEWLSLLCLLISLIVSTLVVGCTRREADIDYRLVMSFCRPRYLKQLSKEKRREHNSDEMIAFKQSSGVDEVDNTRL